MHVDDKLREECGVFGVWDSENKSVAHDVYYGLLALQHRGQESAGIASCCREDEKGNLCIHKSMGLVSEIFNKEILDTLRGDIAIGHVRYSTTGDSSVINAQPFVCKYQKGTLALVHNGNIMNSKSLKNELMSQGFTFQATTDTEVIMAFIALMRSESRTIEAAVRKTVPHLIGGFALVIMSPRKLVGVRDPLGLKPLCLGKTDTGWVLASESCALTAVGAEFVRDIEPGEIVTITADGVESDKALCRRRHAHCVFEYIYFARLDSNIDNVSVYTARFKGGEQLAKAYPVEADIVAGVPESGLTAAAGYASKAGLPFVQAFHKNSYIGRTFIKPTQHERETAVHMKLNVIPDVVKGKRVVLVDDSIVRGTTMANLIQMLRKAGAAEVHVRIASPPFLHPCYYGTDVPNPSQLIASSMSVQEICEKIGADSLGYMRCQDLDDIVNGLPLCKACFDGNYPVRD